MIDLPFVSSTDIREIIFHGLKMRVGRDFTSKQFSVLVLEIPSSSLNLRI